MQNLVAAVSAFVSENPELKRIAVQVPDRFIPDSVSIFDVLQEAFPEVFFFAVTDTSFNDCCVDHISAQHLSADGIIHFDAFCTRNYFIPVCFVDSEMNDRDQSFKDAVFAQVQSFLALSSAERIFLLLDQFSIDSSFHDPRLTLISQIDTDEGFKFYDFSFPFPVEVVKASSSAIIYVGPHSKLATDAGALCYQMPSLLIDSSTAQPFSVNVMRDLAKRSAAVDLAKDATQVGILVENPNIELHIKLAQLLQNLCFANDIFANILHVGRINEAKIGNFPDLECFVHISCAGKESFTFAKPVLTPFEFICAKFEIDFWANQELRDYTQLVQFCLARGKDWISHTESLDADKQVAIKNFSQLTTSFESIRKRYSYYGLSIDQGSRDMQVHKGATGNSVSYDNEPIQ